jgi:hypothetical protein
MHQNPRRPIWRGDCQIMRLRRANVDGHIVTPSSTYLTYILNNARNKSITLPMPDEFTASNIAHVG